MYQHILDDLSYKILFNDYNVFNSFFWDGCSFLAGAFFILWGVKLGAGFLRRAFNS